MCLDVKGGGRANGTPVILYRCGKPPQPNQTWQFVGNQVQIFGKCLDAKGGSSADRTPLILWDCHGGANQRWQKRSDGTIRGPGGKCLDVKGGGAEDRTPIILFRCHGGQNQKWAVGAVADGRKPAPGGSKPKPLHGLDLREAWRAQQFSSRVYDSLETEGFKGIPDPKRWGGGGSLDPRETFTVVKDGSINENSTDTQAVIARNGLGVIFVAFRGSTNVRDSNTWGNISKVEHEEGCKFHRGYFRAYESVEGQLDRVLRRELSSLTRRCSSAPCGQVYFTGHSIGGAVATIAYQRFNEKQAAGELPPARSVGSELYTFGAARAMTWMCKRQFWSPLGLEGHAILNYDDRVAGNPTRGSRRSEDRYVYPDTVYYFDESGRLKRTSGDAFNPDRTASGGHKLKVYRARLREVWP